MKRRRMICINILLLLVITAMANDSYSKNYNLPNQNSKQYILSEKEKIDISKMILDDTTDYGMTKKEIMESIIAERIKLNDKNLLHLVISISSSFFCGASGGNCTMWLVERDGNDYKVLLETNGQVINLEKTKTNGYMDISFPSHMGRDSRFREEQIIAVFKFDGSQYKTAECWTAINGVKKKRTKCGPEYQ